MKAKSGIKMKPPASINNEWYKDTIFYELRIRSFYDSNGDGIGDIKGLTQKLDYLQDLGVTTLWLLPFYPSPKKDDGYDIANYCAVDPEIGTLGDFKKFLTEAHRRGLRVVTELVLNHTSDQHPWFQRAQRAKAGSADRDFYVWSDTPNRYTEVRIIFNDTEKSNWTYDPVAKAYYWHRFFSHQPDLNFDNPKVQQALIHALDFWLALGVDGLRLDAVPYLYERDGTNCENLPETFAFLEKLRAHVDKKFPGRMLLAEANQWPDDTVRYLAGGNKCQMAFHFPIMPRLYMALAREDRFPIIDILSQTPPLPASCQWGIFLRNHDELTLEMVTEEERDEMWAFYAKDPRARINMGIRRRLAPLMENDRRKIELLNMLLFSLPGTPILYYGDEIGMGDNIKLSDRNGVRTPMQWNSDKNAGFSKAHTKRIYLPVIDDYTRINVEVEQNDSLSLLSWTKRVISLRKKHKVFGRGTCTFLEPENDKILAFIREYEDERILVVTNLSHNAQHVALDLSKYHELTPIELFGKTTFPIIGKTPFILTLGPYAVFWFSLEKSQPDTDSVTLPDFLKKSRWFGGKGRMIEQIQVSDNVVNVTYTEGPSERYFVPRILVKGEWVDAFQSPAFCRSLLKMTKAPIRASKIRLLESEQSNTSIIFDDCYILKVYRKLSEGKNLEKEIGLHLTQKMRFPNTPKVVGFIESNPMAILHEFIPNTKNGWELACEALQQGKKFLLEAKLLGKRTAELHIALSSDTKNKAFSPEPYGSLYQQSLYQTMRNQAGITFRQLRRGLSTLPSDMLKLATKVLDSEQRLLARFSELRTLPLRSHRIQIHGDYHLGQVLYTGNDFMIIDFEGEPSRKSSTRTIKRSALYDVAGMLRSFHYAATSTLMKEEDAKKRTLLSTRAEIWYRTISREFLTAYINTAGNASFLPADPAEFRLLLNISLIEKALYEIGYEQNNRPSWLRIPLSGLIDILERDSP